MSQVVLHGDNNVASRRHLVHLINEAKVESREIISLNGPTLTLDQLYQNIDSASLFNQPRLVIIEQLFSHRTKSTLKSLIKVVSRPSGTLLSVILWEPKKLKLSDLKPFTKWQIQLFSAIPLVFRFLNDIGVKSTQETLKLCQAAIAKDSAEFVFYMLARHLRQLLLITKKDTKQLAWQVSKLQNQLSRLSIDNAILLYQQLNHIDWQIKSGQSVLSLEQELIYLLTTV